MKRNSIEAEKKEQINILIIALSMVKVAASKPKPSTAVVKLRIYDPIRRETDF